MCFLISVNIQYKASHMSTQIRVTFFYKGILERTMGVGPIIVDASVGHEGCCMEDENDFEPILLSREEGLLAYLSVWIA